MARASWIGHVCAALASLVLLASCQTCSKERMDELGLSWEGLDLVPGIPYYMEHDGQVDLWTPLHQAVQDRDVPLVRQLLATGADVEGRVGGGDNDYGSPLHIAAMYCPEAIEVLLEHKANIKAIRPGDGFDALMSAAMANNLESAKELLAKELSLFLHKTPLFLSPMAVAEYYGSFDVLQWLLLVQQRRASGAKFWYDDAADAAHVHALRAARAEAKAKRRADEAAAKAQSERDAEARRMAEAEVEKQKKIAEEEALRKKKAQEEAARLATETEATMQRADDEAQQRRVKEDADARAAIAAAKVAAAAGKDAAKRRKMEAEAAEVRRKADEESFRRGAEAAERDAVRRAAAEAAARRAERAAREAKRRDALAKTLEDIRKLEEAARGAGAGDEKAATEARVVEARKKAEKDGASSSVNPSRNGVLSRVHALLRPLRDAKEQTRVDAASALKQQEALLALCRPELETDDESKKDAVEWLNRAIDSAEDRIHIIKLGGIPALIALASSLKSSNGMEQARVTAWRALHKLTEGGLPAEWTRRVAIELNSLVVEGVRSVCGRTSTNAKREREAAATCLEVLTKKDASSHAHVKADERAVTSLRCMAGDMQAQMEQGRDMSRRVLKRLSL